MGALLRITPILVAVSLTLAARSFRRGASRRSRVLAILGALLCLGTWPPVAWIAMGTLEWGHDTNPTPHAPEAQAIVVLSGGFYPPRPPERPFGYLGDDSRVRTRHAAWLHHEWRALPILATGGATQGYAPEATLADAMREDLERAGVPPDQIWTESQSLNTYENAARSAEILREKGIERIVLVTEGFHMRRATACFRKQGLEVTPVVTGLRTPFFTWEWRDLIPSAHALRESEHVLHEWVGLAWYWVRGWL